LLKNDSLYQSTLNEREVHTAPSPHCLNENVFSNRLNWPYDSPHSPRLGGRLFQTCGPAAAKGRTQLSDMGVGDELTVVGQVTRGGVAGQGPMDESLYDDDDDNDDADAGMSSERPIRVLDISARPSPIRTPGRVKLSALVNVTTTLPTGLAADVLVSKSVLGIHLKIPCYRNIGSW